MKDKRYKIQNPELLSQALTHKSWKKEGPHNERLEFLGDAVLGLAIADLLMERYPQKNEGWLSKARSQLVSGATLAKLAEELEIPKLLKAQLESYKHNPRILSGALEACIGAIYLESGFPTAKEWIKSLFEKRMSQQHPSLDYKSALQEWCQKKYKIVPEYKLTKEEGPDHNKTLFVDVFIKGELCGSGINKQKKQAERTAARQALEKLGVSL